MRRKPEIMIRSSSSDTSGSIGYAEGTVDGREFTASWATWQDLGAIFYDTWLDTTVREDRAIARALLRERESWRKPGSVGEKLEEVLIRAQKY